MIRNIGGTNTFFCLECDTAYGLVEDPTNGWKCKACADVDSSCATCNYSVTGGTIYLTCLTCTTLDKTPKSDGNTPASHTC